MTSVAVCGSQERLLFITFSCRQPCPESNQLVDCAKKCNGVTTNVSNRVACQMKIVCDDSPKQLAVFQKLKG